MSPRSASVPSDRKLLRLYLLGSLCLDREGQAVRLPRRKVESLLAFLALHPEPHAREKLAALLWGDSTDEHARHSLRTALAVLRQELGDDVLLSDRETVQLNPAFPLLVDARAIMDLDASSEFGDLESRIEHYRGDLLPDFYDDWILPERERLRLLYLDALLRLAQHYREKSDYARAMEFAQKALAGDPANEKAYQHLIFCLAASSDRAAALSRYAECERVLRAELNVAPSRETIALAAQVQAEMSGARAREAALTNLPAPLTRFIGRQNEIAEVEHLLETARLVSLIGAGGCGKTRLAIQVGTELAGARVFKHGVWWVDLSALQDPAHVLDSVATVLDLHESRTLSLLALLTNYLRTKELLLLLDNCEQVLDACAQLVGTLLPACPQLRVLATSRERLNASGEFIWYVPSMTCPDVELPLDELRRYDAIQLFTERACAVASHWSLVGNGAAVTRICRQLDGIPLAIELAAARLDVLSAEQISTRLADRFNLLTGGSRTELPRHRTLRGTIDWSHDLLSERERHAFRQLSVFTGGWTLEAAEAVIGSQALDDLTALVAKSLVVAEQQEQATRYRMLETIRQYALEKLDAAGELRAARNRHLNCFLELAEEAYPRLLAGDSYWLNRIERDYDNMRAALEHSLATNPEMALRLAMGLEWFWRCGERVQEGYALLLRLLSVTEAWGSGKLRARVLRLSGGLGIDFPGSHFALAREFVTAGLDMARAVGDKYCLAWSLYDRGFLSIRIDDWLHVRPSAEEAMPLFEELGIAWGVANCYYQLGRAAQNDGDLPSARSWFEQCLEMARKENLPDQMAWGFMALGDLARLTDDYSSARTLYGELVQLARERYRREWLAVALGRFAQVPLHEGDYAVAAQLAEEHLVIARTLHTVWSLVPPLAEFAGALGVAGQYEESARLFGAATEALLATGAKRSQATEKEYARIVTTVREHLGEAAFQWAWEYGRKMILNQDVEQGLERAIAYAQEIAKAIKK